ncbi:unnamed protein product [Rhodiola kirilowii]
MQVRRQLQDIRRGPNETMYDYLEKFNHLERSCCTLGLPEKIIIEYLINGLTELDKMLLDASAGGSMMNLSLSGTRDLITNVAENPRFIEETTRQNEFFRTKNVSQAKTSVNSMPEEMRQMKEMMMQLLQKQTVQVRPCEFCGSTDHKTDACPTLIEVNPVEANVVGGYQGNNNKAVPQPAQTLYQPPHKQYNQNAPPISQYQQRGPNQYPMGQYQQKAPNQYHAGPSNQQGPNKWLEDKVKELSSTLQQSLSAVQQLKGTVQQSSSNVQQLSGSLQRLSTTVYQN